MAEIPPERIEPHNNLAFPVFLFQPRDVAELATGCGFRLLRRQAAGAITLRQKVEMFLNLGIELGLPTTAAPQSAKPCTHGARTCDRVHFGPSRHRIRPITPEIRSQSSVSRTSCFSPSFVIE